MRALQLSELSGPDALELVETADPQATEGMALIEVHTAGVGFVDLLVTRGERKREVAREAGAHEVLDVDDDWVAGVRALTDGRGADVVVDPVGGDRFDQSLRCMAPEGRLLVIGFAAGRIPELPVNRLLLRHLDVIGVNYGGFLSHDLQFARRAGEQLYEWARTGAISPVVGPSYPLEQGAQALRDLAERRAVGKPVLIVR